MAINYLIVIIILIMLDTVWLLLFMGNRFGNMVANIQGEPMVLNLYAGIMVYILLGIGITYFGINRVDPNNPFKSSIINGGLFGLICFGVFDFTNLAVLKNYELSTAILDTVWGGILCASTTYLSYRLMNFVNIST